MKLINAEALFTVAGGNVAPENRETFYASLGGLLVGASYGVVAGMISRRSVMTTLVYGAIFGFMGFKSGPAVAKGFDEYYAQRERLKHEANNQAVNS
jgi:hypothetical protein